MIDVNCNYILVFTFAATLEIPSLPLAKAAEHTGQVSEYQALQYHHYLPTIPYWFVSYA